MSDLTPKEMAEKIIKNNLKGKQIESVVNEFMFKTYEFSGHTIDFWRQKFTMEIPTADLNPAMIRELDMKLMLMNQEATFHYAVASAKLQMLKRGSEANFMEKYQAIITQHQTAGKKLPAAATLERMSSIGSDEVNSAITIADMETRFWKNILDSLSTTRKILENASMNNATEMKYLSGGNVPHTNEEN